MNTIELLRGAEAALRKALPFLPADKEAHFVGEWLVEIAEANRKQEETNSISIEWSVEDVLEVRPDLNEKLAANVLRFIKRKHDAEIGVNWEVIKSAADTLYG